MHVLKNDIKLELHLFTCLYAEVYACHSITCEGKRTAWRNWLSHSTMEILRNKIRLPGLEARSSYFLRHLIISMHMMYINNFTELFLTRVLFLTTSNFRIIYEEYRKLPWLSEDYITSSSLGWSNMSILQRRDVLMVDSTKKHSETCHRDISKCKTDRSLMAF